MWDPRRVTYLVPRALAPQDMLGLCSGTSMFFLSRGQTSHPPVSLQVRGGQAPQLAGNPVLGETWTPPDNLRGEAYSMMLLTLDKKCFLNIGKYLSYSKLKL